MIGAWIWLVICLIMGAQSNQFGLGFGLWLFTTFFVCLSAGGSYHKQSDPEIQDIYWRKVRKERKEAKDKKGTIEYTEKKR